MSDLEVATLTPIEQLVDTYQQLFTVYSECRTMQAGHSKLDPTQSILGRMGLLGTDYNLEDIPQERVIEVGEEIIRSHQESQRFNAAVKLKHVTARDLEKHIFSFKDQIVGQYAVVSVLPDADAQAILSGGNVWRDRRYSMPVDQASGIITSLNSHGFHIRHEGAIGGVMFKGYEVRPVGFYTLLPQVKIEIQD
jgi:hypothetical protein